MSHVQQPSMILKLLTSRDSMSCYGDRFMNRLNTQDNQSSSRESEYQGAVGAQRTEQLITEQLQVGGGFLRWGLKNGQECTKWARWEMTEKNSRDRTWHKQRQRDLLIVLRTCDSHQLDVIQSFIQKQPRPEVGGMMKKEPSKCLSLFHKICPF